MVRATLRERHERGLHYEVRSAAEHLLLSAKRGGQFGRYASVPPTNLARRNDFS